MKFYPIFLSVVIVVRNQKSDILGSVTELGEFLSRCVKDYEILLVDNASDDGSVSVYKDLTGEDGVENLQVFCLAKHVDWNTAYWAGVENSLGDFVVTINRSADDISFLPEMLEEAVNGADCVFASNAHPTKQSFAYKSVRSVFGKFYNIFSDVSLPSDTPRYVVLSKAIINYILRHPRPSIIYRHLPTIGGFVQKRLSYNSPSKVMPEKSLVHGVDKGIELLVSSTRAPMRMVTFLALFGAISNLLYSVYVILIALYKADVAPGWVSLSLQQSGMFFLLSLVLLVLGEYILHMAKLSGEGPSYHIANEFTSARMVVKDRLNIEEGMIKDPLATTSSEAKS